MPLPSAPLGQLPNMNMPFSIPTYEKGPSIWERALASFLVNAAGEAATAGVKNTFEGEHAQDFGEQGNGFSKLWKGAKVNDAEAKQRNEQKFQHAEGSLTRQSGFDLESKRQAGEDTRLGIRESGDTARANLRETGDNERNRLMIENQLAIAKQHGASAVELEQMRQTFEQPYQAAKIKETGQLGDYYDSGGAGGAKLKMMQQMMDQLGGPKKPGAGQSTPGSTPQGVDPTVASYHANRSAVATPSTKLQSDLQTMLANPDGQKAYPTGEQIMSGGGQPPSAQRSTTFGITVPNMADLQTQDPNRIGAFDTPEAFIKDLLYNISRMGELGDASSAGIDKLMGIDHRPGLPSSTSRNR